MPLPPLQKTLEQTDTGPFSMLVYGDGGVGKTSFAATAPKAIMADCEPTQKGGTKYLGKRGIALDFFHITDWPQMAEFHTFALKNGYETVVIDPIGELMEKLMRFMAASGDRKRTQGDGSPSMAGWGWLKETMRAYIKILLDSGLNVLVIAHSQDEKDEEKVIKVPMIATKIRQEIINMFDASGFMTFETIDGKRERVIITEAVSEKFKSKDRTGQLPRVIVNPNFGDILKLVGAKANPKIVEEKGVAKMTPEGGAVEMKPAEVAEALGVEKSVTEQLAEKRAKAQASLEAATNK